jgi:hypothetical protein
MHGTLDPVPHCCTAYSLLTSACGNAMSWPHMPVCCPGILHVSMI